MMSTAQSTRPAAASSDDAVFIPDERRTTNKSCFLCRERRVRCDRTWPACKRCSKRREDCQYGPGVSVETKNDPGESVRVAELEAKLGSQTFCVQECLPTARLEVGCWRGATMGRGIAAVQAQLYATQNGPNSYSGPGHVQGPPSSTSSLSNNAGGQRHSGLFGAGSFSGSTSGSGSGGGSYPGKPPSSSGGRSGSDVGASYASSNQPFSMGHPEELPSAMLQMILPQASTQDKGVLMSFLFGQSKLGTRSLDSRLAAPQLAQSLTLHLLDASQYCCCSKLSSFKALTEKLPYLKANLSSLSPVNQAAVAILSAIGARGSPHSALLGIDIPGLANGTAPPSVYLTVGARRENACRALADRAIDLCWYGRLIKDGSRENLEVLVGLSALLILDEVQPRKSRFILRNATGMFEDLQRSDDLDQREALDMRQTLASALFRDDAVHAAQLNQPPLISSFELNEYFMYTDQQIPDFGGPQLSAILEQQLRPPDGERLSLEALERAVNTVSVWVCFCQRTFARITTGPWFRRPRAPSALGDLATLWRQIDTVHSSVQRLQQFIVALTEPPPGSEGDPYVLDHYVLLAVRADTRLVDLVNLMHKFLMRPDILDGWGGPPGSNPVEIVLRMRVESDMRVRKVLKLLAFYAQLYLQSQDKHVVHHLFMQLELLPSWTLIALQRVGAPGGPTSEEFELTPEELEWFAMGLRLAVYYTPRAAVRLHELTTGRHRRSSAVSSADSSATPALYPSPNSELVSPVVPYASVSNNAQYAPNWQNSGATLGSFPPVPILPQADEEPVQLQFNLDDLQQFDIAPPPDLLHIEQQQYIQQPRQQEQQHQHQHQQYQQQQQHHHQQHYQRQQTQQQQSSQPQPHPMNQRMQTTRSSPSPYFGNAATIASAQSGASFTSQNPQQTSQQQHFMTGTGQQHAQQQHVFAYDPFPSPASGYPPTTSNYPAHPSYQIANAHAGAGNGSVSSNPSGMRVDLPPSPFVFDAYGYPKKSPGLVADTPIAGSPGAQSAFKGQSWMNVAFTRNFGELEMPIRGGNGGNRGNGGNGPSQG
ncbi:BQ2448_7478 [Microbotryum intermedium]|uniref:BQ2448_7478 protein n=1 Tax=Microbotryum intermedium TaxID=269621 RepID=A0A238FID3_9BASI|nr:BQ2448_7478 [Microbotryum intermedium]